MSSVVSKGGHRRRIERVSMAGALPVALAIVCSGVATAAPAQQPGVGVESETPSQPGVPAAAPEAVAEPAPAEPMAPAEPKEYWVAPPVEYDNVPTRPAPTVYYEEDDAPIAPAAVQQLHLPVPVEPVAPIEAPAERLRLGDYVADKPNWLTEDDLAKTNNTAAAYEAQVNTAWRSVGIEASRADRIGAATIGGAAVTGLGFAAGAGIPAAVAGGLIGGAIGTAVLPESVGIGTVVLPVAGTITAPVVTVAAGAAIGAAAAGIPVAVVAGTIGGVVGAAHGMAFGAGDTLAEPIEMEIPDAPTVDPAAITEQTRATVAQVETLPGGPAAVDAVRDTVAWVPPQLAAATEQARTTALGQPGGPDLIRRVEASATATADTFAPVTTPVNEVLGAIGAGLV